jgi:hypothetical protein
MVWQRLKEQRRSLWEFRQTARGRFKDLKKKETILNRRLQRTSTTHIDLVVQLMCAGT